MSIEGRKLKAKGNKRWFGQMLAWAMIYTACLMAFGTHYAGSSAGEPEQAMSLFNGSDFSITKAEGNEDDEIFVTYTKKDCFLSGVNSAVAFQYKSGAEVSVMVFWPRWGSGETKTFRNTDFRQGPIQKMAFCGTAIENSFQDGKKTATWVTFSERKRF